MDRRRRRVLRALTLASPLLGCEPAPSAPSHDLVALQDPQTCEECHPTHYREWLGSMHAYASEDPVFRAMNAKAQRETNGATGDFCVRCHAPLAVELGLTQDGLNLDEVPQAAQGVGCYFCHQVTEVAGTHNNPLGLAMDSIMRGAVSDPLTPDVHDVDYSPHLDGQRRDSSTMCGSCHDIVTPGGAHIERTFAEWSDSFFSDPDPNDPDALALYGLGCTECHMTRTTGAIADYPNVRGDRDRHSHMFVGVDVAVSEFPDAELGPELRAEQLAAIETQRKSALCSSVCVRPDGDGADVTVWLHNEAAGHSWPSGATPDRRAWLELVARDDSDAVVFSSGVVTDDEAIAELDDPNLWLLRDRVFDADGNETHSFWLAASVESELLPAHADFGAQAVDDAWKSRTYVLDVMPSAIQTRVRLQAIGREILAELVASGDLDPAVLAKFETFDVAPTVLEWTPSTAIPSSGMVDYGTCVSSSPGCFAPALK